MKTYRQYTHCYEHTPGDKPFHESDLVSTVAVIGGIPLVTALISYALGAIPVGGIVMAIGYAGTIAYVANQWLNHRLVCIDAVGKCAIGTVVETPKVAPFGEFDNDEFFDLRLMPHRPADDYKEEAENHAYKTGQAGPSLDGQTESQPANDVYLDNAQGTEFMKPRFEDLGYKLNRTKLHVEAEGNFWQAMWDFALVLGAVVGTSSALGAAGGAAAGCAALSWFFGPVGCLIGGVIGAILGGAGGAAAGAYISAQIAFHSDPGSVEEHNIGDLAPGPISEGDWVAVIGRHVYDGFHEGWHEIHPLWAVVKIPKEHSGNYLEWDPEWLPPPAGRPVPEDLPDMEEGIKHLEYIDMKIGLASPKFRSRADWLKRKWCTYLTEAFLETTAQAQAAEEHRWTIHPDVDGCASTVILTPWE